MNTNYTQLKQWMKDLSLQATDVKASTKDSTKLIIPCKPSPELITEFSTCALANRQLLDDNNKLWTILAMKAGDKFKNGDTCSVDFIQIRETQPKQVLSDELFDAALVMASK